MNKLITLFLILIVNIAYGQQNCREYIVDDWNVSRYQHELVSTDRIVSDSLTGLMWKQCTQGLSGKNCNVGTVQKLTWRGALESAVTSNVNAGFAGYNDWRVPNLKELNTLLALNCFSPSINLKIFPNTTNGNGIRYWSSTPNFSSSNTSWVVDFFWGETDLSNRQSALNVVRLVRGKN